MSQCLSHRQSALCLSVCPTVNQRCVSVSVSLSISSVSQCLSHYQSAQCVSVCLTVNKLSVSLSVSQFSVSVSVSPSISSVSQFLSHCQSALCRYSFVLFYVSLRIKFYQSSHYQERYHYFPLNITYKRFFSTYFWDILHCI